MKIRFLLFICLSFILLSCNTTSPTKVKKSDAQKITSIEYGYIISSSPIKIKGEGSIIGATAGGLIGGLLGTQVCGEEEVIGTKCQDIAVVYGTIGGAAIGYVTEAMLGNHDGFQYVIDIDNSDKDIALVQGDEESLIGGERVVILYGDTIRILPFAE
tara:strand:+ start:628 stop:1101 length:474 start_codon:yes stop_codon:yes gene_type:complete